MPIGEIADLKNRLEIAQREKTEKIQRLSATESRVLSAEKRAQEAEMALHDLAGKIAVDNITATRKITGLEATISDLNQTLRTLAEDYQAELEFIENRIVALREKLARLGK